MTRANQNDLDALKQNGWAHVDGRDAIEKAFKFKSFKRAMSWMVEMSYWAEAMNHHPEWSNVYNRVTVVLTTHDTNGLTDLDVKLARKMDDTYDV